MVVDAADRAPCCPGHGDATLRVAPWMLDAACPAGWLLCRPARQATVEGRHDLFCTLYLVPANAPELPPSAQRGLWVSRAGAGVCSTPRRRTAELHPTAPPPCTPPPAASL